MPPQDAATQSDAYASYSDYFRFIASNFSDKYVWSIRMVDLSSGKVLGQLGEEQQAFEPGNLLKPLAYSAFLETGAAVAQDEIDVSPITYKGNKYVSLESDKGINSSTVRESFQNLNNPAMIRIWTAASDTNALKVSFESYGMEIDESKEIPPYLGYGIAVSDAQITNIYDDIVGAPETPRVAWSDSTKTEIDTVLSQIYQNTSAFAGNTSSAFSASTQWVPYGVFDTIPLADDQGMQANFAGYLKNGTQSVGLFISVQSRQGAESIISGRELVSITNDIFHAYIASSYFAPVQDLSALPELNDAFIYWSKSSCPNCDTVNDILLAKPAASALLYLNTEHFKENPAYETVIKQYNVQQVPCITYQRDGKISTVTLDFSKTEQALSAEIDAFLANPQAAQ